jgi:DNA-binding GntR family transcriptional regulator
MGSQVFASRINLQSTVEMNDEGIKLGMTEVVVEGLRERILNWDYPPGHRLTEDQLCKEYGVSRSPVREALHRLETGGFIERLPRRGYVVKQLDLRGVEELYELRLALEQLVVERLCEQGETKSVLNKLGDTWRGILQNPPASIEEMPELDRQFHESLAAAIDNEMLLSQYTTGSLSSGFLTSRSVSASRVRAENIWRYLIVSPIGTLKVRARPCGTMSRPGVTTSKKLSKKPWSRPMV